MSEAAEDMDLGAEGGVPPDGQSPDVFADVPADGGLPEAEPAPPGGGLGGDGATLEELEGEPPVEEAPINGADEPVASADPLPEPGEEPAPEPPAPEPEPEPTPTPAEAPPAEPEPEAKPKPASKKGGGKKGTTERVYHILQQDGEGKWSTPESLKDGVKATNGEAAMRAAYSELVDEDSDDAVTLAVIPAHYWNPKTVQSKVKRDRAIEIV